MKFLFLLVFLEADRGDAVGLKEENEQILEGEEVREKRPDAKDENSHETNDEKRPVLQRDGHQDRPDLRAKQFRRTLPNEDANAVGHGLPWSVLRTRGIPE